MDGWMCIHAEGQTSIAETPPAGAAVPEVVVTEGGANRRAAQEGIASFPKLGLGFRA